MLGRAASPPTCRNSLRRRLSDKTAYARVRTPDALRRQHAGVGLSHQGGTTHEGAGPCSHAVARFQRARSRSHVRLRLQRRGRRYRHVHAAGERFAAAGPALQGGKARDADDGERGQALSDRRRPVQAVPGVQLDKTSGALNLVGTGPLAESYPYVALDRTGRFLLGASYAPIRWG
jgi:hypothetical protein